jgi:putative acetyltransferase
MAIIREERPQDHRAVYEVNRRAFETAAEAEIVEAVRRVAMPPLSLVAVEDDRVVGHILLSPVTIRNEDKTATAMGLGPMSVLPEFQKQGIGSQLVRAALESCRKMQHNVVFVLGHTRYYPRFGFEPAALRGLHYKNELLDTHFMVAELEPGALDGLAGIVEYLPEFD